MSGLRAGCPGLRAGCPGSKSEDELEKLDFGAEIDDFGAKLRRFHGWKVGKLGEMLDPLETKQIHGSKSTKHHQTNKSQKNLGLFLWGNFRIRNKINKTRLENKERGLRNRDQRGS